MGSNSTEAWVTYIEKDEYFEDVLILANSLRHFRTNRKLLILAGSNVTPSVTSQLEVHGEVLNLDFGALEAQGSLGIKISIWALPFITKCVVLDPKSHFLTNCDEIFELDGIRIGIENLGNVLLTPDRRIFANLKEWLSSESMHDQGQIQDDKFAEILVQKYGASKIGRTYDYTLDVTDCSEKAQNEWELVSPGIVHILNLEARSAGILPTKQYLVDILKFRSELSKQNSPKFYRILEHQYEPIAIVGMSGRFPGADNIEEFWNLLMNQEELTGDMSEARRSTYPQKLWEKFPPAGYLKSSIDQFDAEFFGMTPKDASLKDPQHRLLMEVAWEALEDAAINPLTLRSTSTGVYAGLWRNDYVFMMDRQGLAAAEWLRIYIGNAYSSAPGRIAHFLGLEGPNVANESGCSASLVSLGQAMKDLREGRSELALVGGSNLLISLFNVNGFMGLISPDGRCKTFEANANGFGRAEGCAVIVLKKLSKAVRDKDRIYALIRGYGACQEGSSSSAGTPTTRCEARAIKAALEDAGVGPDQVNFVEVHGTGTAVGDVVEVAALAEAYSSEERKEPLIIGALKPKFGHTESCSGVTSIIKIALALYKEVIPPNLPLRQLNPDINFESIPAIFPTESLQWERNAEFPRLAGVSSFGITGTDAHVIIEEPPRIQDFLTSPTAFPNILTLSAKTDSSLQMLISAYSTELKNKDLALNDICFTANTGRAHFRHRTAIVANTSSEVLQKLNSKEIEILKTPTEIPKLCFLFPGQGTQRYGMGKALYSQSPVFRFHFDECDEKLQSVYGLCIKDALWGSDESLIHSTIYSQTTIFVIEFCLFKLFESWGIRPDYVLGHSTGEFAAAAIADILSLEDALQLVTLRAKLIDKLPPGKMVVVRANLKITMELIESFVLVHPENWLDIAAENSIMQTTVVGSDSAILNFVDFCTNQKIKTHVLEATHAYHSRAMDAMLEEYRSIVESIQIKKPNVKYVSSVHGKIMEENEMDADYWIRHTREPVKFLDATHAFSKVGCTIMLELGPSPVLSALVSKNIEDQPIQFVAAMRKSSVECVTILEALAKLYVLGVDVNWNHFHQWKKGRKISLPFYPFQRSSHWIKTTTSAGSLEFQHPLLGSEFPNPTEDTVFHCLLDTSDVPYLLDHCIMNNILFPGAGFLEMSLVAGFKTLFSAQNIENIETPIVLKNITIQTPLKLIEGQTALIETVCHTDGVNGLSVKTYSLGETNKWTIHTAAYFHFNVDVATLNLVGNMREDLTVLKLKIPNEGPCDFYENFARKGYKFGPQLQRISSYWKNSLGEILAEVDNPFETQEYIIHPLMIDAMFQTSMIDAIHRLDGIILIPVSLKEIVRFAQIPKGRLWIHRTSNSQLKLYSDEGELLVFMDGLDAIQTTENAIERALKRHDQSLPHMFVEEWIPSVPPFEKLKPDLPTLDRLILQTIQAQENIQEDSHKVRIMNEVVTSVILMSLLKLGWEPKEGMKFRTSELMRDLRIKDEFYSLMRRFLHILVDDGFLHSSEETEEFVIQKSIPSLKDLEKTFQQNFESRSGMEVEWNTAKIFKSSLADILSGKLNVLEILFPRENRDDFSAEVLYTKTEAMVSANSALEVAFNSLLAELPHNVEGVFNAFEIGAGTGSATEIILPLLEKNPCKFNYIFTDISPAFFPPAVSKFGKYGKDVQFKILDIEKDPKSQGFAPEQAHVIIASNVLHATKYLRETVRNVRHLLRPGGHVILIETFKPIRLIDMTFGLTEGYWRFQDFDIRRDSCVINGEQWRNLFLEEGFSTALSYPTHCGYLGLVFAQASESTPLYLPPKSIGATSALWLIFGNEDPFTDKLTEDIERRGVKVVVLYSKSNFKESLGNMRQVVNSKEKLESLFTTLLNQSTHVEGVIYGWSLCKDENVEELTKTFLQFIQVFLGVGFPKPPPLFILTKGIVSIIDQDAIAPSAGVILGMTRSARQENRFARILYLDLSPNEDENTDVQVKQILEEIWRCDNEHLVAFRNGARYVVKLTLSQFKDQYPPLVMPNSSRTCLTLPSSNSIVDLKFGVLPAAELGKEEVEVKVEASGLNFRDIFSVIAPFARDYRPVGSDFAGIVTRIGKDVKKLKVGDSVCGNKIAGEPLKSHVTLAEDLLIKVPQNITMAQACSLPAIFSTVHLCLGNYAKLQPGEWILLHAASGGVGLCAIQYATHIGANIIATAGSRRKKTYLKSMGIEHVFSSRDLSFGAAVMKVTGGQGVNVVLNSLTGPGFKETSLACCASGARFIEMSKNNVWAEEDVQKLRSDVKYIMVDITKVGHDGKVRCMEDLETWLIEGKLKPLPYTRFDWVHVRDALKYLEGAKQIGKVVLMAPGIGLFNDRSTYLITGGGRGIGIEVAHWMVKNGAKNLVLCGRSPPTAECNLAIEHLTKDVAQVLFQRIDVGNVSEVKTMLDFIDQNLPPLRGVMHAAGVLSDGSIPNQTWDKFKATMNPKVSGVMNLHTLTLNYNLEHFVMFSSMAALLGIAGQSNHAGSNTFMDAFAHYRHNLGLPALSINWGQWGEAGVATSANILGINPMSTNSALNALATLLNAHAVQACVCEGDFASWTHHYPWAAAYIEKLEGGKLVPKSSSAQRPSSAKFWEDFDSSNTMELKLEVVQSYMASLLSSITKLDLKEDLGQDFQALGMDSLMLIELRNSIQTLLGEDIPIRQTLFMDYPSVGSISKAILEIILEVKPQ